MNSTEINTTLRLTGLGKSGIMATELSFGGIPIIRVNVDEAKLVIEHSFELAYGFLILPICMGTVRKSRERHWSLSGTK